MHIGHILIALTPAAIIAWLTPSRPSTPHIGLHTQRIPGGRGDHLRPADVDARQLARGITVELEHTRDPALAREIALDHLAEFPDYYTRLTRAGL